MINPVVNKISVGVIIPTYNRASMLKRAIESVLRQDYPNITHIVVTDDGSTDNTREVVEEFQKRDSRIVYIQNTKYMKGPAGNKNNGLDYIEYEAKPDFFCFVDDDDELFPEAISSLISIHENNPEYEIIISNSIDSQGKLTGKSYDKNEELTLMDFLCERYKGEYFHVVKTSLLKGRRMKEEMWGGEFVLGYALYKEAKRIYYYNKVLRRYNTLGERVTSKMLNFSKRQFFNYKYVIDLWGEDLLKLCPKIYAKHCLSASLFAKLSGDRENFKKYLNLALNANRSLEILLISMLLFLPKRILVFLRFGLWPIISKFFFRT